MEVAESSGEVRGVGDGVDRVVPDRDGSAEEDRSVVLEGDREDLFLVPFEAVRSAIFSESEIGRAHV